MRGCQNTQPVDLSPAQSHDADRGSAAGETFSCSSYLIQKQSLNAMSDNVAIERVQYQPGTRTVMPRYRWGGLGYGSNDVVRTSTPPRWMDQSGSNFQGVISTYGRTSSNIWFFKKPKYKKLCLVKLPGNTECCPSYQAELGPIEDQDTWKMVLQYIIV